VSHYICEYFFHAENGLISGDYEKRLTRRFALPKWYILKCMCILLLCLFDVPGAESRKIVSISP
jgi:hypothetical protein